MRNSTTGRVPATPTTTSRLTAGTIAITKVGVATALPTAEQIGQMCELITPEFKSTQQCICAARRMIPNIATTETRLALLGIKAVIPSAKHTTPLLLTRHFLTYRLPSERRRVPHPLALRKARLAAKGLDSPPLTHPPHALPSAPGPSVLKPFFFLDLETLNTPQTPVP